MDYNVDTKEVLELFNSSNEYIFSLKGIGFNRKCNSCDFNNNSIVESRMVHEMRASSLACKAKMLCSGDKKKEMILKTNYIINIKDVL